MLSCLCLLQSAKELLDSHLTVFYLTGGYGKEDWGSTFCCCFSNKVTGLSENLSVSHVTVELRRCPRGIFPTANFLLWKNCTVSHGVKILIATQSHLVLCPVFVPSFSYRFSLACSFVADRCCNIGPYYTDSPTSLPCRKCRFTASETE